MRRVSRRFHQWLQGRRDPTIWVCAECLEDYTETQGQPVEGSELSLEEMIADWTRELIAHEKTWPSQTKH